MIKVEQTSKGAMCQAQGSTFGLIAECTAVVDTVTKIMQESAKVPMDREAALRKLIETIYETLHNGGIDGKVLFYEKA